MILSRHDSVVSGCGSAALCIGGYWQLAILENAQLPALCPLKSARRLPMFGA
jgi:hypothetical protein